MKKNRILSLIISGLLVVPMVGCNANLSVGGKEIFNFNDTQIEEPVQPQEEEQQKQYQYEQTDEVTKDEILSLLLTGEYTLYINEDKYVYNTKEMLKALYDGNPQYKIEKYMGTQYSVQVSDIKGENFVTFLVDTTKDDIAIVEFNHNNEFFEGQDASDALSYVVYSELFNEEDATLTKKQHTTKEETKKEQEKSSKEKEKTVKEEKKEETPKTCKWCYTNQLPSGSGENDKCTECTEENWNFYCNDCNKSMTLEEYWSYGHDTGFCPPCYDKYLATTSNNDVDHKTYYCDRCGKDTTFKNFLQDFEGYSVICEGCLLELGY